MAEYAYLHFPADAVKVDAEQYDSLPTSARMVFEAIKQRGPLTHNDLRMATNLPARTVRFAVKRLKDQKFVASVSSLRDCRKCYFHIERSHVDESALEAARLAAQDAVRHGRFIETVGEAPGMHGDVVAAAPRPVPVVDFHPSPIPAEGQAKPVAAQAWASDSQVAQAADNDKLARTPSQSTPNQA